MLATEFLQEVERDPEAAEPGAVRWLESKGELPDAWVRWHGGFRFELLRDFCLQVEDRFIEIEAGFPFDGASIRPRLAWVIISPAELGVVPTLVHDHLYRTGGQGGLFTRKEADRLFLRHMEIEGVPQRRPRIGRVAISRSTARQGVYRLVRTFGAECWQS